MWQPLLAGFAILLALAAPVNAQGCEEGAFGCGHVENHEKYKTWNERPMLRDGKQTRDGSCCNGDDCRPVRADQDMDGNWRIWVPEFKTWVSVPPEVVGEADRFGDLRNHACTSKPAIWPGSKFTIYCFSPGRVRS